MQQAIRMPGLTAESSLRRTAMVTTARHYVSPRLGVTGVLPQGSANALTPQLGPGLSPRMDCIPAAICTCSGLIPGSLCPCCDEQPTAPPRLRR